MKKLLVLLAIFVSTSFHVFSQTNAEKAAKYLKEHGELEFTFIANNLKEVKALAEVVSFDHGQDSQNPLTIKAIANQKTFQEFLKFNLPYSVSTEKNEPVEVEMYNRAIHGAQARNANYTLTFPLTAYPTYADYAAQMSDFATENPAIAQLVDIGNTNDGKDLLFIKLSDNVGTHEQEPRLMFTSSMHGDEIAGYPMMLSLIDFLIEVYNDPAHASGRHTEIKNLIDTSEIWINPMANPDGTFNGDPTFTSVSGARRGNGNNIDLNRNYPDPRAGAHPDGEVYQIETTAFMTMADTYHFVISANFHGGTEVMNYPWDTWSVAQGRHADDEWYMDVCGEYAAHAQADSPNGYFDASYDSNADSYLGFAGVTHGATWYQVAGGRQDYMNHDKQCREVTVELSNTKIIPSNQIENHWDYNKDALIDYLKQGTYGFRGVVKDASTTNPIDAKITIVGHDDARGSWVNTELPLGDFYRPIKAGTYDILIEADCYQSVTLSNQVITNKQIVDLGDISLTTGVSIPTNLAESNLTLTGATLNWDGTGTSYDIRYRVSGSPTWINDTSATASLALSSLTLDTTYEYQVRSICNATTSSYSTTKEFTTLWANYCTSEGSNISDEYIGNVELNGVSNNTQVSTASGYTTNSDSNTFPALVLGSTDNIINVTKYWTGTQYDEGVSVWIDFNRDGTFGPLERLINSSASQVQVISSGNFTVPIDAELGNTRMRVSMAYNTIPSNCEAFTYGEVEDYTIVLTDQVLNIEDEVTLEKEINVYPNPAKDLFYIRSTSDSQLIEYKLSNILGQDVLSNRINDNSSQVDVSELNKGVYFLTINTIKGRITKKVVIE